ncbi:MAG: ATP-binding protein [Methanobrevibacter sp.]|jgi:anti-sigma regulatory factor (Ser/Thr protein kinase)|nr:ATP-binding protein [Candidatus Methanovirga basalitermitum]
MENLDTKNEIIVFSTKNELGSVLNFVHDGLREHDPSKDFKFKLNLVIEEIFLNIIKHAYKGVEDNYVKVFYMIEEDPLAIKVGFIDKGILFNPVEYMNNLEIYMDIISSTYEEVGYGIVIIKNNVDDIQYKTENNHNILIFKKYLKKDV